MTLAPSPSAAAHVPRRAPTLRTVVYAVGVLATLALTCALRYPSLFEPRWYGDEGIFAAIAENMRHGRGLYSEAWDNKPPLIFFTYVAVQSLAGSGVGPLHAVTSAVVLATQAAVMATAAMLFGGRRAIVAGVAFSLAMSTPVIEGNLAMTETYMILPSSLAMLVFVAGERRARGSQAHCAVAGVLLGVAAGYKQVAVFDALAIVSILWLTHERPVRPVLMLAGGFAGVQIALSAIFVVSGAFGAYWYAVVGSLALYAQLAQVGPFVRFAGFLPALLILGYLERRRRLGGDVTLRHLPMLWLGFAIAGATSSSFEFPHYLQQAAPAAALLVVSDPLPRERDDLGRIALVVTGLLVVAVVFGQFAPAFRDRRQLAPVRYYRTFVSHQYGTMSDLDYAYYFDGKAVAVNDISRYIEQDGAGDTLYTWAELPWVFPATRATNPARYYTSFLGELVPGAKAEILDDLAADPPVYVVVSDDSYAPFPELDDFLRGRYVVLRAQGDWRLYRLATATGALAPDAVSARLR